MKMTIGTSGTSGTLIRSEYSLTFVMLAGLKSDIILKLKEKLNKFINVSH